MNPRLAFAALALLAALGAGAFFGGTYLNGNVPTSRPLLVPLQRLSPEITERLFASRFRDQNGEPQVLKQWHATPLLINFWASWCPPCRAEIPDLARLHRGNTLKNGQIIGISVDLADKSQKIALEAGATYPLLLGEAEGLALLPLLGNPAQALPYTLIIDRKGEILLQHAGRVPFETLRATWEAAQATPPGENRPKTPGK